MTDSGSSTSSAGITQKIAERIYAGWLGKCIGVRFGAPLENWTYEEIRDHVGELEWYLKEDEGKIFKPDDDTSVPMILIRACEDYPISATNLPTAQQIGETLLNYVGDGHGTFWWGGYGISTEHTAYMNLAAGIEAPRSGSMAQNGKTLAEQIGGQIFSDIWGLIAPNNPSLAAEMAARASSVTHDGAGIDGGKFIAALVSAAFSERDPRKLIEIGLQYITPDGEYARVVRAMVDFHAQNPDDWRAAYAYLKANFGYDKYGGIVHIIPNAGVVALGLLYGEGDFSKTIRITNMCGWDTDCNVGNVGAIMGVAVGTDGIDSRWRDPINDVLIAASVIGTRNLLTIPQCADIFVRIAKKLAQPHPLSPSPRGEGEPTVVRSPNGEADRADATPPLHMERGLGGEVVPKRHFHYPGSTNNFTIRGVRGRAIDMHQTVIDGVPVLQTAIRKLNKKGEIRIATRTYYRTNELSGNYYGASFTPLVYPGQTITARVRVPADAPDTLIASLYVEDTNNDIPDDSYLPRSKGVYLTPGVWQTLTYTIPERRDAIISEVGIELGNIGEEWTVGSLAIAELDWYGTPNYETTTISGWSRLRGYWRLEDGGLHGSGVGECELYTGEIDWTDYTVTAHFKPLLGEHHLINFRVQGARRSYAFGLAPNGRIALYKKEGSYREVASAPFKWDYGNSYEFSVITRGSVFSMNVKNVYEHEYSDRLASLEWTDDEAYRFGQVGLSVWNGGHIYCSYFSVTPNEE